MDTMSILYPVSIIGGLGLFFGLGLGVASKLFAIQVNPLIPTIREALPGANCGACGYTGCDAYAKAIVESGAPVTKCPVGGAKTLAELSTIMGIEAKAGEKMTAFVKCNGTCQLAAQKYEYQGVTSCLAASYLQGEGPKACQYGCLGFGDCIKACQFGAITLIDGVAVINKDKCVSCEKCVVACPKALIEMVPAKKEVRVRCNSRDKGKAVMSVCKVGCIACQKCVKVCKFEAIHVEDGIAHVDYQKCVQCNACAKACPTSAIIEKVRKKAVKQEKAVG